jgi:hypothetical protein
MIEWPRPFRVSSHRIGYRDPIQSLGYRIKVSAKPLDEAGWAAAKPLFEFRGPVAKLGHDGLCSGWTTGDWPEVEGRFLRIEWFGHNGSEQGTPGRGHPDLIVGKIQLYGPNQIAITPVVSAAQSAWAGGTVTLDDAHGGSAHVGAVIDDSAPDAKGFGYLNQTFASNPGDADPAKLPAKPASFVVTLQHTCLVEAVGYSSVAPPRDERPRDLQVWTSPHAIGDRWELQRELRDIAGGAYEEISFAKPVRAKRVKFVIGRVWNTRVDASRKTANGYLAELYVYGTGLAGNLPLTLPADAVTSASLFDARGQLARTLWQLRPMQAGRHLEEWDGLTDSFADAPPGRYELRLVSNAGRYENVAAIGNSGVPPDADGHVPMSVAAAVVDGDGAVFTANGWDEAGHDWKKWDRDGRSVLHANFQVRNGDPNGLPYRVAVDEQFLYVAYIAHGGGKIGSQWIQRFDRTTGKAVRFPKGLIRNGLIQVYPPPEADSWEQPLTGLALAGSVLLVGDRRANRVLKYDKATGEKLGEFACENPGAMAVDGRGRLWIVRDETRIVVLDAADGKELAQPLAGLGRIAGLSVVPASGRLYVADDGTRRILVCQIDNLVARLVSVFGRRARPGDSAPERFYELVAVAAGADGGVVVVERFPVGGSRVSKFAAGFACAQPLWTQLGLEFTGNANYAPEDPDTLVSHYFHRYRLDKQTGAWQFAGNLFSGGYTSVTEWHGVPRWLTFNGRRFFYFANGDGMQAYRLLDQMPGPASRDSGERSPPKASSAGPALQFVMALGGREPAVDGRLRRGQPLGQWSWTDANGNGTVQEVEVRWFKQPGSGRYAVFGMNVDRRGNILYCDHHTRSIWMIPLAGLNAAGNPMYDWAQAKEIVAPDASPVKFFPLMAVRTEKDDLYAFGRSDLFPPHPGSGPAWMGGWALAKFDSTGRRRWATRLAQHCTGMDYVPGDGGVVLGYFAEAVLYHYNRDGLLVGSARPGKAAGGVSGWLDNTSSIACNRDPRDGKIDVFAEEDYAHRILWYRLDDSQITVQTIPVDR